MSTEKRAYYTSLRLQWLENPKLEVESWQVENYREMSLPLLFSRLRQYGVNLGKEPFLILSEECETPEELADMIAEEEEIDESYDDPVYLLLFELWRRLQKDKPCLSIFCDELDHQIHLYGKVDDHESEELQDALANLKVILDENVDEGGEPHVVFEAIDDCCAHQIETFLYDFISEQIDNGNHFYASELLDSFEEYVMDLKWFELLRSKHLTSIDPDSASSLIEQIAQDAIEGEDLDFNIEVLNQMVEAGNHRLLASLVKRSIELIEEESDFQDLLAICADYYRRLDFESKEKQLLRILDKRPSADRPDASFRVDDPDVDQLMKVLG